MIPRNMAIQLERRLEEVPVVALLGSRQVGKTTLAQRLKSRKPVHYLDLERPADLAKLSDPELYLERYRNSLVILDEIQQLPELFPVLRGLTDRRRMSDDRAGHFLVLGSASPLLLRQTSESLAGRVSYLELPGLSLLEVGTDELERLWFRGGYPDSFTAASDDGAMRWCTDLITSYVERDLPQRGIKASPMELRRMLSMLAHQQGSLINYSELGKALGWDQKTVKSYCDLLESLFLVRQLPPWSGNLKKRLVKSPKVFLRDAGLLHSLLGLDGIESLLGHPVCGHSWEGFCIEQILNSAGVQWRATHYRTHAGSEIDLILENGQSRIAIEIKRTLAPRMTPGLREALKTMHVGKTYIIIPGSEDTRYPLDAEVEVVSLAGFLSKESNEI